MIYTHVLNSKGGLLSLNVDELREVRALVERNRTDRRSL
jgi:hypothetical protein